MKEEVSTAMHATSSVEDLLFSVVISNSTFINSLPLAIYSCGVSGQLVSYNMAATAVWGFAPKAGDMDPLLSGSLKIFSPGGETFNYKTQLALWQQTPKTVQRLELIVERTDGSRCYLHFGSQPVFDKAGKLQGNINTMLDISAQRTAEEKLKQQEEAFRSKSELLQKQTSDQMEAVLRNNQELREREERYHKMVEEVEDYAIILLDQNGIILNWNKGAEKIKGYKDVDILGKSFSNFYLEEDRKRGLPNRLIGEAAKNGKAVHEGWRKRKDGTAFWGSIVLTALHDSDNNVIGFSKVTRDLTEKKLTEDKLKEYTSQLEFQNEQLEQFAYAASHDMKEPLRKILFYNNHLWDHAAGILNEKEREYLNRSLTAAHRMQKLLEDLLEYSKASSYKHAFEKIDLNETLDEVLSAYKDAIDEAGAIVHRHPLPLVKGIPFQLKQLFDNLISNALKYAKKDEKPEISISAAESKIYSNIDGLAPDLPYYKITVADKGIGFNPENSEKIFELFQRLGVNYRYSGTGVGLALCKKIVQNHHGAIIASGEVNEGARFDIYLPA